MSNWSRGYNWDYSDTIALVLFLFAGLLFLAALVLWVVGIVVSSWTLGGVGSILAFGALVSMLVGGLGFRDWG